jgi:hypothetical protein
MASYQPIQSEEIILSSDMDKYVLVFRDEPRTLIVQVYNKDGILKNLKVNGNIINSNGKTVLNAGDTIKYIAVI